MLCLRIGLAVAIITVLFGPFGGLFRPAVTDFGNYSPDTVNVGESVTVDAPLVRIRISWR